MVGGWCWCPIFCLRQSCTETPVMKKRCLCIGSSADRGQGACIYLCKSWVQEVGYVWPRSSAACSRWNADRCARQPVSVPQERQTWQQWRGAGDVSWPVARLVPRQSPGWDQDIAACLTDVWPATKALLFGAVFSFCYFCCISSNDISLFFLDVYCVGLCNQLLVSVYFVAISFSDGRQVWWWWWRCVVIGYWVLIVWL